jgi:hypothetical protein
MLSNNTNVQTIQEAAAKHNVDERRLRGAVFQNRVHDPIGDPAADLVQDDETLARWVEKQTWA